MLFPMILMDITGTIAFAVSGALVAIHHKMDIFGVNILAVVTATGGGMIRDIIIGTLPPVMFRDSLYVLVAAIMANITFVYLYFHKKAASETVTKFYEQLYFWFDTLGLAAFTADGVVAGYNKCRTLLYS